MMSRNNTAPEMRAEHNLFGIRLPFEIVVKTISHLDQLDWLRYTELFRSWYSMIPQHAQDLWDKI